MTSSEISSAALGVDFNESPKLRRSGMALRWNGMGWANAITSSCLVLEIRGVYYF